MEFSRFAVGEEYRLQAESKIPVRFTVTYSMGLGLQG